MTEEEKNEIYKEAFKCMLKNEKTSKDILSRFSSFETQYKHLDSQDYGNIRAFLDEEPTFQRFVKYIIDEKSKQNQIFKNLKKAIEGEESIIEQIKALSRKRIVAVIGKNHKLINGVFTYLWLTSPYCNNKPEGWLLFETPIRRYFCSVIGEYMPNRIEILPLVHFIGLNVTEKKKNLYKIQEFLERRSNQINNIRSIYIQMGIQGSVGRERMVLLKDTNCESEVLNILVRMVSDGIMPVKEFVISMDTLPAEFEDQFEPIYLEPEKQGRSVSIQQTKAENVFRWCGGTWEITFEGQTIRPSDSHGLRYIHCLLANPSKNFHVSELMKAIPRRQKSQLLREKGEKIEFEDELNGSTADDSVDEAALKQYKERLAELSRDIKQVEKSGISMELEELRKEFNKITDYLKTVTGKKGRPRKLLDQSENQRQAVKNCIIDAFAAIKKEHAPLFRHFKVEKTIKLGLDCSYNPPKATSWVTR